MNFSDLSNFLLTFWALTFKDFEIFPYKHCIQIVVLNTIAWIQVVLPYMVVFYIYTIFNAHVLLHSHCFFWGGPSQKQQGSVT